MGGKLTRKRRRGKALPLKLKDTQMNPGYGVHIASRGGESIRRRVSDVLLREPLVSGGFEVKAYIELGVELRAELRSRCRQHALGLTLPLEHFVDLCHRNSLVRSHGQQGFLRLLASPTRLKTLCG